MVSDQFFAKFKNSSKLCWAISQAQIDLFWKFKNLKSSIFNELPVYHAGICHFGGFMVFLGTLTDKTMKNRVRKFMIFKNCNFFILFFSQTKLKVFCFQNIILDAAKKCNFRRILGG